MRMILLHGWVRKNSTKDCLDTSVEITGLINSVIKKTKWPFQPVEFQSFLLKNVESAKNSIRAREKLIYLA